jgi:hypothetical protein
MASPARVNSSSTDVSDGAGSPCPLSTCLRTGCTTCPAVHVSLSHWGEYLVGCLQLSSAIPSANLKSAPTSGFPVAAGSICIRATCLRSARAAYSTTHIPIAHWGKLGIGALQPSTTACIPITYGRQLSGGSSSLPSTSTSTASLVTVAIRPYFIRKAIICLPASNQLTRGIAPACCFTGCVTSTNTSRSRAISGSFCTTC